MATRIIFNGQEYASTDAMPEEVRRAYLQALAQFADADQNGIPDILEQGKAGNVIGIEHSSITVNGRTYESQDAMPALVRALYQHAMRQASSNRSPSMAAMLGWNTPSAMERGESGSGSSASADRAVRSGPQAADGFIRALDHTRSSMERVLRVFLGVFFVSILGGAVFLMLQLDSGHRQVRLYVAIAALLLLGTLDTQVERLLRRRTPFSIAPTEAERRYSGLSLLVLLAAAVVLIGLAWLLP
jgi:hypothetical protein